MNLESQEIEINNKENINHTDEINLESDKEKNLLDITS